MRREIERPCQKEYMSLTSMKCRWIFCAIFLLIVCSPQIGHQNLSLVYECSFFFLIKTGMNESVHVSFEALFLVLPNSFSYGELLTDDFASDLPFEVQHLSMDYFLLFPTTTMLRFILPFLSACADQKILLPSKYRHGLQTHYHL